MTARRIVRAPTLSATGCPSCGAGGIPGTPCAACVHDVHGAALREIDLAHRTAREEARGRRCEVVTLMRDERERRLTAWVGAQLLLDELGVLLVRVGFEVPEMPRSTRGGGA